MNRSIIKVRQIINVVLLFLISINFSCNNSQKNNFIKDVIITIDIQPFADISKEDVQYVFNELKKNYPHIELNKAINLPQLAYYPTRNRYRADSLINYLSKITPDGHVTIGLTTKDISTTKDTIVDWGVMGLGFCPGNACMVSTFRLSKDQQLMQLFKVAIHELGHTQGLPHCSVKTCFMRDAEGHNTTNEEVEFCEKCKTFLVTKGWKFKS